MQKKLIALAVIGLMSGSAFAADNNVTLYGKIDLGLVHDSGAINNSAATGSSTRLSSGVAGGSRIGIKGTEDLGGGLKTSFLAETGFCADTNTGGYCTGGSTGNGAGLGGSGSGFMSRQAWLNLSGDFGTLSAGRQYTPGFALIDQFDPFDAGLAGQSVNLFNFDLARASNSVAYVTPSMGGFSGVYAHAFGEVTNNSKSGAGDTIGANYANGPLALGVTYLTVNDAAGNSGDGLKNTNLGASYDFGVATLMGEFQTTKSSPQIPAGTAPTNASNWELGVTVPMGGGVGSHLLASYVNHNDKTAANQDATQVGIGYFYGLSKMTQIYTAYAHINNKNGAAFTVGNATDVGVGNSSFNLGVEHNF